MKSLLHPRRSGAAFVAALIWLSAPALAQDPIRGGQMYDKWWTVNGAPAPAGEHPLYPPAGQQAGTSTFRCKECHGWDYAGAAGAYGPGSSHFTGIPGVLNSLLTPAQMFEIIKNPNGDGTGGTTINGHDFSSFGLSDADINDIVEFLQTQLIDTGLFLNGTQFVGDEVQGQTNYTGIGGCLGCHGSDGTAINFGTPEDPEWVGTVAIDNPWEFMHKVRFGQPGSLPQMPSWVESGGSNQGVADIGVYAQQNFPSGPEPSVPTVSEWGLILMGLLILAAGTLVFAPSITLVHADGRRQTAGIAVIQPALLVKSLLASMALTLAGITAAMLIGGPLSVVDTVGVSITAPLAGYVAHLWLQLRR